MKSMAMYVGYRPYDRKAQTLQDGTVIKEAHGYQYMFYCSDWEENKIDDMGRTRFVTYTGDNLPDEMVDTLGDLKLGQMCEVSIRENFGQRADNACRFIKVL